MYGDIKKGSIAEDEIKETALKLIHLVSNNPKYNPTEQGNVDFEAIHKESQTAVDTAMDEILNPKLILPSKKDILETIRKLEF